MTTQISQQEIQQTAVRFGIPDHPFIHRRIARAFDLVATGKVSEIDDSIFRVKSQFALSACDRTRQVSYIVETNHFAPSCTCKDSQKTLFCKHQIASRLVENEQRGAIFACESQYCDRTRRQSRKPSAQNTPKLTRNFDYDRRIAVKETPNPKVKASWVVTDGNEYTNVWQDLNGKICCVCGAYYEGDCIHKQLVRDFEGTNSLENECGTSEAKALQEKLNGNNGTGGNSHPSTQLDTNDPFQECEQLDIDQIEGRSNGDLVHVLSNGECVISYNGIMKLAEQHGVTFEASRHDETHTVIAYGRCGSNSRASGKPINGAEMTAMELAKRNAARQLLPLPEIKALEHKVKLECEFNWEVAKRKCLEVLPEANLNCIIYDLIRDDKLREAHPSDYKRKEWLLIYDTVKADAETNGHDNRVNSTRAITDSNNGGANTPSSPDKFTECRDSAKDFVRYSWLKDATLKEGVVSDDWTDNDIAKLKSECKIDASLFDKELGHWTVGIQPNRGKWAYQRRWSFWLTPMSRRCFWCAETEGIMPDTFIHWGGRYEIKSSLCLECSEKVGNGELSKERLVEKFDEIYRAYGGVGSSTAIFPDDTHKGGATPSEPDAEVPDNVDEFIAKCKKMESEVDDNTDDNSVAELATAPMVEGAQMDGDEKRKLQMDKKLKTWLVEADGTKTEISCREICEQFNGNIVMQLRSGIDAGGDISTVELDN